MLYALAIFIFGSGFLWLRHKAVTALREARWEDIGWEIEGLSYSDRDRPLLPLIIGMVDELSVVQVAWGFDGPKVYLEISLAPWARPEWLYKRRLSKKVKRLLREGGVHTVVCSGTRRERENPESI